MDKSVTTQKPSELFDSRSWIAAGQAADSAAARSVFVRYKTLKAANTLRRQEGDLALFSQYLRSVGLEPGDLQNDPHAWQFITWGMIDAFIVWQLSEGYAIGSVNVRLATIKTFARLATKAGTLSPEAYGLIAQVRGIAHKDGVHVDGQRLKMKLQTRKGLKKAKPVSLSPAQADLLMSQPDTPLGRRDAFLMCILLEQGLRVGEAVRLTVTDFDLESGLLNFYRPKVDIEQTHELSSKTLATVRAYFKKDAPMQGIVWRVAASAKEGKAAQTGGKLIGQGISERAVNSRVAELGSRIGLVGLSPHDCRHYWATQAARNNTPLQDLQDSGGWSSPAMPMRYVEKASIKKVKRGKV